MRFPKFVLCRSDKGDGGWSLHQPNATDEGIATGETPPLITGTAQWDETLQEWDRPNIADYQSASAQLRK